MTERQAVEALQTATDRVAGVPFTVLAGGGSVPDVLGRAWLTSTFDMIDLALQVQRRALDQTLEVQQQFLRQVVDAGSALSRAAAAPPQA